MVLFLVFVVAAVGLLLLPLAHLMQRVDLRDVASCRSVLTLFVLLCVVACRFEMPTILLASRNCALLSLTLSCVCVFLVDVYCVLPSVLLLLLAAASGINQLLCY